MPIIVRANKTLLDADISSKMLKGCQCGQVADYILMAETEANKKLLIAAGRYVYLSLSTAEKKCVYKHVHHGAFDEEKNFKIMSPAEAMQEQVWFADGSTFYSFS